MQRKPRWLVRPLPSAPEMNAVRALLNGAGVHTVCQEAMCPNAGECFAHNVATFLIMGDVCTRNCRFCAVSGGRPRQLDESEPERVAQAAAQLGLRHVVVTSVTRDDLPDGGAAHFAATIAALRRAVPGVVAEVLTPDFQGDVSALETVLNAAPDIFAHNVETVPRLYALARHEADYARSLAVLAAAKRLAPQVVTKSGLMLGLGESLDEVRAVLRDLRAASCDMLTLGQYLQPSQMHLPVVEYVSPSVFDELRSEALALGFADVAAGPLVRSSYLAEQGWNRIQHNTEWRDSSEGCC